LKNALVGVTGFVGSTLCKQTSFESFYRSTNINEIDGQSFDTVVCAAAPAQKWIANKKPQADMANLEGLISHLKTIQCKTFILISTVDVFQNPLGVDEQTMVDEAGLHPYGMHRRHLEKFVESHFPNHLIARLPGLVGPGLRKNVIYDFLNKNNLNMIESRGVFQFYPMINLWYDLQVALKAGLRLVHLTAEPIGVAEISALGFGGVFDHTLDGNPASYDMRTLHAKTFGGQGSYQYSSRDTIQAVRAYAQTEPITLNHSPQALS
jgi:hypothetical protein